MSAHSDHAIWLVPALVRHSVWAVLVAVVVLVIAVCWLAHNTDATRIRVPGVIVWEEPHEGPGVGRGGGGEALAGSAAGPALSS
jgi:hypothetical protein